MVPLAFGSPSSPFTPWLHQLPRANQALFQRGPVTGLHWAQVAMFPGEHPFLALEFEGDGGKLLGEICSCLFPGCSVSRRAAELPSRLPWPPSVGCFHRKLNIRSCLALAGPLVHPAQCSRHWQAAAMGLQGSRQGFFLLLNEEMPGLELAETWVTLLFGGRGLVCSGLC